MTKLLIAGPCVGEHSEQWIVDQAGEIYDALDALRAEGRRPEYTWVFKCSFDKANRTEGGSYRGLGMDVTLNAFQRIKELFGCLVTTDVHEVWQVHEVSPAVDFIQIPAMLSRQTDLISAAARAPCAVNIKLGTTMTALQVDAAVDKANTLNGGNTWITYRGTTFGDELVFDPLRIFQFQHYAPIIADVTHSTASRQGRWPIVAQVAAALNVDGLFMECHPDPHAALSDSKMQLPIGRLRELLEGLTWAR